MDEKLLRFQKDKLFCFCDLETFNLNLSFWYNRPWQVGFLLYQNDKIQQFPPYYLKWNTELKISKDAARVTRFNQKEFDKVCQPAEDIFPIIREKLDCATYIVGNNFLAFDLPLVIEMYKYFGYSGQHLHKKVIDTHLLAKALKLGIEYNPEEDFTCWQYKLLFLRAKGVKTNLTTLGKEYGVDHDYESLHDANSDIELNIKIFNKMKYQLEI